MLDYLHPDCNFNSTLFSPTSKLELEQKWNEECRGQYTCSLDLELIKDQVSSQCKELEEIRYDDRKSHGYVLFRAKCESDSISLPFNLVQEIKIHKQDFAHYVILSDLFVIFSVAIFMAIIKKR
jgi:hypothetical protein